MFVKIVSPEKAFILFSQGLLFHKIISPLRFFKLPPPPPPNRSSIPHKAFQMVLSEINRLNVELNFIIPYNRSHKETIAG